jgi:hypothetical protein
MNFGSIVIKKNCTLYYKVCNNVKTLVTFPCMQLVLIDAIAQTNALIALLSELLVK